MRARKLSRSGRIIVYFLSFLLAFSSTATFAMQSVQAAVDTSSVIAEENLGGILTVSSIVSKEWESDENLRNLLTLRDLEASLYARENNLLGTYTQSGSLGSVGDDDEWLSNVMYEGSILRTNSFAGFDIIYGNGDATVIKEGLNEIDVTIIPKADTTISSNNLETDINSWSMEYGFASLFVFPHWNGDSLDMDSDTAYHTKIFVVGIKNQSGSSASSAVSGAMNRIYDGSLMNYVEYLSYIGAEPSDANFSSYLDYVSVYKNIDNDRKESERALEQWHEWERLTKGKDSRSSSDHRSADGPRIEETIHNGSDSGNSGTDSTKADNSKTDNTDVPIDDDPAEEESPARIIMMYMDIADLETAAKGNLSEILAASATRSGSTSSTSLADNTRYYILTGGTDASGITDFTYDGTTYVLGGPYNQLWVVHDGILEKVTSDTTGDMTEPETLVSFVSDVKNAELSTYGSIDRIYDLIMWSHSTGSETGFGQDSKHHASADTDVTLTVSELREALEKISKDSGITFDFIAFDSCYMSNTEIALALAPYASYLIASETTIPNNGMGYTEWLKELIKNPDISTADLGKAIIDYCIERYDGDSSHSYDRSAETIAMTDLDRLVNGTSGDNGLYTGLMNLATLIHDSVLNYTYSVSSTTSDPIYEILTQRKKYLATEGTLGVTDNGLVDLRTLCQGIIDYESTLSSANRVYTDACKSILSALSSSIVDYDRIYDSDDAGSVPYGISVYFPSQYRLYSSDASSSYASTVPAQIETLLTTYNSTKYSDSNADEVMSAYRKAIAAYGLWLTSGELMRKYWDSSSSTTTIYKEAVATGLKSDMGTLITTAQSAGLNSDEINKIIEKQINDSIQKSDISVAVTSYTKTTILGYETSTDEEGITTTTTKTKEETIVDDTKRDVTISGVNPDFVDRIDVKISISDLTDYNNSNSSLGSVSLGYSSDYDTQTSSTSSTVKYTLDQYDNQWLTLDGSITSYYDTESDSTSRKGIIPVAYWTGKAVDTSSNLVDSNGYMSLTNAIKNGYLVLGVFEVTFPVTNGTASSEGTIQCFRTLSTDSLKGVTYDVNEGDNYELIGNFDSGATENNYSNLVSLGTIAISASTPPGFSTISKLHTTTTRTVEESGNTTTTTIVETYEVFSPTVEYSLVDAYESRYELNITNFPSTTTDGTTTVDSRNLDSFKAAVSTTGDTVDMKASKYVNVKDHASDSTDTSRTSSTRAESGNASNSSSAESADMAASSDTAEDKTPAVPIVDASSVTDDMVNNAIVAGLLDPGALPVTGDPEIDVQTVREAAANVINNANAAAAAASAAIEAATAGSDADTIGSASIDTASDAAASYPAADTGASSPSADAGSSDNIAASSDYVAPDAVTTANPITGESISVSETGVESRSADSVSTEYVTPSAPEESSQVTISAPDSPDPGSGDGGDGGSDGDSGSSDGGGSDGDSDSSDSGSDSSSSESSESSD